MAIDQKNLAAFVDKVQYDEALLIDTIEDIIRVVLKRYYQSHYSDDEVWFIATAKAKSLLHEPHIDSSKNLVNTLFTGIRNEVGNYLRRDKKQNEGRVTMPDEVLVGSDCSYHKNFEFCRRLTLEYSDIAERFADLGFMLISMDFQRFTAIEEVDCEFSKFAIRAAGLRALRS